MKKFPLPVVALASVSIGLLVALLLTATWSPIALTDSATGDAEASSSYLYVLTGETATLDDESGGVYALTLEGAATQTTYFSDRPRRDAGTTSVAEMVDNVWNPDLPAPNVALVGTLEDGTQVTLALELRDPVYDADANTFAATAILIGNPTPGLDHFEFVELSEATAELSVPVLFIDTDWDRCYGEATNNTDVALTRTSYSPTAGRRWSSGGPPPATIAAGETVNWTYRWHDVTQEKDGRVTYRIGDSSQSVEFTWSCRFEGIDQVTKADCKITGSGSYSCTGRKAKFLSEDLGTQAYFAVDD